MTETPNTSETGNLDENGGNERENNNDSQELENFISAKKSSNTVKKTKSDMIALRRFCATINETREPETLTAAELDKLLQCVRIGDAVSKVLPLEFGVPQGSILGPVLFTIYVNDLLSVPKRCISASYVDDCKLYLSFSPANLSTSIFALNEDLMRISQWCCKNFLLINPDKTKVLAVGVPQLLQKLSQFSITLLDKDLTPVPVVRDLGVHLDVCLSYNEHITKTVSKCLLKLKQINRIKHLLDRKTLLLVMNSFVFSKLLYCSTIGVIPATAILPSYKKSKISLDELFWD